MGITVSFNPAKVNCGVVPPGGTTTQTAQCGAVTAPVNVTASITDDHSGGAITILSVASFITKTEIEFPDPGDLPPGTKPVGIRTVVLEQIAQSNGVTPLAIASGQSVVVTIQFAPARSTAATCSATLLIQGDTWNPVSIPISAAVGELSVMVPVITVRQGAKTTVDVKVTSVAGKGTPVKLIMDSEGSAYSPNVVVEFNSSSSSTVSLPTIDPGKSGTAQLTVTADPTLAIGQYQWALAVWGFNDEYSFSVQVVIKVGEPYYFIKSKLDGNVIDIAGSSTKSGALLDAHPQKASSTDNQLWEFIADPAGSGFYFIKSKLNGNVIDIQGASTQPAALLDAFPQKAGADNQLWEFVSDPAGSGYCFILSKLNGMVIDIQGASKAAGASLEAYPLKVSGYDNQLWEAVGGVFPSVVKAVAAPSQGLGSNHNYLLYNYCDPLLNISVTIDVTHDVVWESSAGGSVQGLSFQLNCYAPAGYSTGGWQQYVVELKGTELVAGINTYNGNTLSSGSFPYSLTPVPSVAIPKGYKIKITLTNDGSGNVSSVTFVVIDSAGKTLASYTETPVVQTPIVAFDLNLVGPEAAESVVLSAGAGTITYSASSSLTPQTKRPGCAVSHDITGEKANSVYGVLPASPGKPLTQSFTVSSK
jgi:Ricin-type beta-trefoil lectin domain-like